MLDSKCACVTLIVAVLVIFALFRRICFVPHLFWSGTSWDETMQITMRECWMSLRLSFISFHALCLPWNVSRWELSGHSAFPSPVSTVICLTELQVWLYSCLLEVAFTQLSIHLPFLQFPLTSASRNIFISNNLWLHMFKAIDISCCCWSHNHRLSEQIKMSDQNTALNTSL